MKKVIIIVVLVFVLSGCGASGLSDFTGTWSEADTSKTYQQAIIENNEIVVYFVNPEENSKMLYWAGTYDAPEQSVNEYSWESINDTEKTDASLFGSGADTKVFTYKNGKLSYEVSMMGVTATAELQIAK